MELKKRSRPELSPGLLEAIRGFPPTRGVQHCGGNWEISSFDFYAHCPQCGKQIKVRSFSSVSELEDVFDAVFEWMNQPGADSVACQRRRQIENDDE